MTHKDTSEQQEQAITHSKTFELNNKNIRNSNTKFNSVNFYYLIGITALVFALIFVIFYLPKNISKPELETDSKVFMEKELNKAIDESPWHEAQLSKHRKTSQTILAKVLDKQNILEQHQVELWGKEKFDLAFEKAKQGDLSYRLQEFNKAISLYTESLTELTNLEHEIEQHYQLYLKKGSEALANNNATRAKKQLQIAMYLKPTDVEAQEKYDRALVLDEVLSLNNEGVILIKNKSLDNAKKRFLTAIDLDKNSQLTQDNLKSVEAKITQRDFSKAMSQGYISLNNHEFKTAIKYFTQAQKIIPDSNDPNAAILQSKNQQTQSQISNILKSALELEKSLKWQAAAKEYNKVLLIDSSLTSARVGLIRTKSKADLEHKLNGIINYPARLSNNNVYQEAQNIYKQATEIQNQDVNLLKQITSVQHILRQSKLPINIEILSDDLTRITIYRIGDIGHFTNKNMSLKPGEYTLIGSRNGYRDIRKVVNLLPGSKNNKILVKCVEKVNNG
jgi:tetratricopeptide (TPR) repeat protein